jgi:hypothetical protein
MKDSKTSKSTVSKNLFEEIKPPKISENLAFLPSLQPPPIEKEEGKE